MALQLTDGGAHMTGLYEQAKDGQTGRVAKCLKALRCVLDIHGQRLHPNPDDVKFLEI